MAEISRQLLARAKVSVRVGRWTGAINRPVTSAANAGQVYAHAWGHNPVCPLRGGLRTSSLLLFFEADRIQP